MCVCLCLCLWEREREWEFIFYIYSTWYQGTCMKVKAYWTSACCSITLSTHLSAVSLSLSLSLSLFLKHWNCTDMAPTKWGFFVWADDSKLLLCTKRSEWNRTLFFSPLPYSFCAWSFKEYPNLDFVTLLLSLIISMLHCDVWFCADVILCEALIWVLLSFLFIYLIVFVLLSIRFFCVFFFLCTWFFPEILVSVHGKFMAFLIFFFPFWNSIHFHSHVIKFWLIHGYF